MTDTVIRTSIEHADIRAEAVLEPWSGHGEGGTIANVIIRGGEYGTYESTPADFQRAKADAARINAALNAHETCDRRGPYCPETHQACERMCQSICNMRTGEPAKADP